MVLTIEVTGWCSANQRTGPGMPTVGTNAERDEHDQDEREQVRDDRGQHVAPQDRRPRDGHGLEPFEDAA